MEETPLHLPIMKLGGRGIICPWLTRNQTMNGAQPVVAVVKDFSSLWPNADTHTSISQKLENSFEIISESFEEIKRAARELLLPRRLSIPDTQLMKPVPVTPHTNKIRKTRARSKISAAVAKTIKRLSKMDSSILAAEVAESMNEEDKENGESTKPKPRARTSRKNASKTGKSVTRSSKINSSISSSTEVQEIVESDAKESDEITKPKRKARKKQTNGGKRVTRSSRSHVSLASTMPEIQEITTNGDAENEDVEPLKTPPKRKTVKIEEMPAENVMESKERSSTTPEPMEGVTESLTPQENDGKHTPVEVQHLISLHETLIEKQQQSAMATQSLKKISKDLDSDTNHASPDLRNNGSLMKPAAVKRDMEERVLSCMKKKPVVNVAKLQLASPDMITDSPQQPITLTFDVSDEEDIADSIEEENTDELKTIKRHNEKVGKAAPQLPGTPISTVPPNKLCPPRRSLDLQLRLSLAESDLDNSGSVDKDNHMDVDCDPQPLPREMEQDSLENADKDHRPDDANNTASQASSSVCSSSAATVVFDSEEISTTESQSTCSSEEEGANLNMPTPKRRSTRLSKRLSVVTGLAAKRLSQAAKLSSKKQAAEARAYEKSLLVKSSEEEVQTSDSSDETVEKKRPKIVKPIQKPPRTRLPASSSANRVMPRTGKRNLDSVESHGLLSPAQPKLKPSFQCTPTPAGHFDQKSRSTFLNRSTAASRARRTPGHPSPASASRTRAALLAGSPFKFNTQSMCLSPVPKPANLTADVQSFIRRNTPQKANYEEQLAAKKELLKEKQKRERELSRRREEEKQRKIEEKKRKRSQRLRKAAEQRERREREEKEKQQKQVEQWEKRIADADKVKVLRKKEETAKAKKIQKKLAEAEEIRRKEEEDRIKKLKEQEQEKDQRLQEQKLQKEQEAAARRQAEQEKLLEKQRLDRLREEKEAEEATKRQEEERMKREEEEKAKRKKAEEALKLKQQKIEKEEAERKKKMQEEIEKRNAEAAKLEQERIEKEKEAQRKMKEEARRRQEEAIRRKEREEARKRKLEEAKAAAIEKAMKRKQEELAKSEELRRRREEIRREAERRREEERLQREEEKRKQEEERKKQREAAEKEKLRKIQESNDRLRKLEEEHRQERERLKAMNHTNTANQSLHHTPAPSHLNSTYTIDPNSSRAHGSPQSYDITPQVIKKHAPSTEDNYNIDDLASGDSTDDDEAPRKVVPKWAKGGNLRSQLIKQYYTPPNMQALFCDLLSGNEMRLDEIFNSCKARYFKRTSSAHWTSPIMPVGHISFTDQCRGFDYSVN